MLINEIEKRIFQASDSVCFDRANLVTEAFEKHKSEPAPRRRALIFDHVLRNMTLDLESNPFFAGNTSSSPRAWTLMPEFGFGVMPQVSIEHDHLDGFLHDRIPSDLIDYWDAQDDEKTPGGIAGWGHMSLDFDLVVNEGLESIAERIEEHRDRGSRYNRIFRDAMKMSVKAVIKWSRRYAEAAQQKAEQSNDPKVTSCYERIAEACRHVPAQPARNFFEGLQSIALIHLATVMEGQGVSISIGLPDRVLSRFADEVSRNPDEAVRLTRGFLLKIAANSYQGSGSKTQAITIGGRTEDHDACNSITETFLKAFNRTPVNDPHLFLRWHQRLDPSIRTRGYQMLSEGRSMPLLVNDHQVVPGLRECNVAEEDVWDYCIIGCNEVGIPGKACKSGMSTDMGFDDLELIDGVIREQSDPAPQIDDLLDQYEDAVYEREKKGIRDRIKTTEERVEKAPFPFCSAFFHGCVEAGGDLLCSATYSNIYGVYTRGTTNAVNALAAIEDIVHKRGKRSLDDLIHGVDQRDQDVLEDIAEAPKWGNDDERADRIGVELNSRRDRALDRVAREADLPPFPLCHVVRSLHYLDGRKIGNTLDGREAGRPVADSIGRAPGTRHKGPTAVLNSVLKLDADQWFAGIYNLNLTLPSGPQSQPEVIEALAQAFFKDGGQELQLNVLDPEKLRRAQDNPREYEDLVVRVAGLNARFVELSAAEQEELIRRAEAVTASK